MASDSRCGKMLRNSLGVSRCLRRLARTFTGSTAATASHRGCDRLSVSGSNASTAERSRLNLGVKSTVLDVSVEVRPAGKPMLRGPRAARLLG